MLDAMPLQRRYSITGQTPPDAAGMKSPKLQALDTNVQGGCGLCDGTTAASTAVSAPASVAMDGDVPGDGDGLGETMEGLESGE
jgi:hypothetical protein